jgi:transposase-like protein
VPGALAATAVLRGAGGVPGKGHLPGLEEEVRRLKRELERVRRERDILGKAVAFFSRDR